MATKSPFFKPNQFYIIRADKAGVFMGKIKHMEGKNVVCTNLRRLYYWQGALDVTQIAIHGVYGSSCKFSVQMGDSDESTIFDVIEHHPASEKAITSINNVKEWKK